ncbi:hypothetical protein LK994_13190 [Ferruginibacter lapsinanis]|uniref:hypothetical protein n=1 Tax=Ferruginibacter lapsinanis TaxID=563172 RepID=UPI001E2B05C1|nr:hypothetical protein [Ferruginibacter lapsinanis]UEG49590.1 hypothetical protein LK994_13190 [Ferruginibacter lapsinanis]
MIKKITLFILLFSVKFLSAQKLQTLYYKSDTQKRSKRSIVVISKATEKTSVSLYNKELLQLWRKKTSTQINADFRSAPNILAFSYSSKTGQIKLSAPTVYIRQILKKNFEFSDAEITASGL